MSLEPANSRASIPVDHKLFLFQRVGMGLDLTEAMEDICRSHSSGITTTKSS